MRKEGGVRIDRIWAMPDKWTFTIPPIKSLIQEEVTGISADPFSGENSPATHKNDIVVGRSGDGGGQEDALTWLRNRESLFYDTVLYDPPYSITQARMYGKAEFSSMAYWADCKNEISRIVKVGGKVICFGWNSMGIGKNRGFRMTRILLVPHGGSKNDTIVTVETKE